MLDAAEELAIRARGLLGRYPIAAPFLADWPASTATRAQAASRLPVLRYLGDLAAGAAASTRDATDALVARAGLLSWRQSYAPADFGAAFLLRYGWTELIGLRGPIASARIACGFLLLGPMVRYPRHAHEAEEVYVPLSGTASWQAGEALDAARLRPPGDIVHHAPWMPHATQTFSEPLLALYAWRGGDLAAKSKIVPHG